MNRATIGMSSSVTYVHVNDSVTMKAVDTRSRILHEYDTYRLLKCVDPLATTSTDVRVSADSNSLSLGCLRMCHSDETIGDWRFLQLGAFLYTVLSKSACYKYDIHRCIYINDSLSLLIRSLKFRCLHRITVTEEIIIRKFDSDFFRNSRTFNFATKKKKKKK